MAKANADGEFQVAARYWDAKLRLEVGDRASDAVVQTGRFASFSPVAGAGQADVTISGPVETWADPRAVISMLIPAASRLQQGLTVEWIGTI